MENPQLPQNYEQWRHCITVDCGLELTQNFIEERIVALQNQKEHTTQQFVRLYGEGHLQRVLGWFVEARERG